MSKRDGNEEQLTSALRRRTIKYLPLITFVAGLTLKVSGQVQWLKAWMLLLFGGLLVLQIVGYMIAEVWSVLVSTLAASCNNNSNCAEGERIPESITRDGTVDELIEESVTAGQGYKVVILTFRPRPSPVLSKT
jgi:hypothetical protein